MVHCRRTANGSRILLHQEPFVATGATLLSRTTLDEAAAAAARPQRCRNVAASGRPVWWIPVSLTNSQSVKCNLRRPSLVWLSPRNPSVELISPVAADRWILANFEFGGYFRVNYDDENWELLADQLMRNHTAIPLLSRAQLLDDAFVLALEGVVDWHVPKRLIRYLKYETAQVILANVADKLGHIISLTKDPRQRAHFAALRLALATPPPVQARSRHRSPLADHLRPVDCRVDGSACTQSAVDLFNLMIDDRLTPAEHQ